METACYWKKKQCISMIQKRDFFDQSVLRNKKYLAQHDYDKEFFESMCFRIINIDKYGYDDLHYLYYPNIISAIKSRMRWAGHVERLRDGEVHTGFW
jgi:antitoxin component HigA of HigAB toxin-antitoxin module